MDKQNQNLNQSLRKSPLLLGFVTISAAVGIFASAAPGRTSDGQPQVEAVAVEAPVAAAGQRPSLADGTYTYGQVSKPGMLGREYLVFQVEGDRAVGAIYLPRSEFNCFDGRVGARQLSLSIADDYSNESFPLAIALVPGSPLASNGVPSVEFGLQGYHRLEAQDPNELRILSICRRRAALAPSGNF